MLRSKTVGQDMGGYANIFSTYSNMSWGGVIKSTPEVGFALLNKLVSVFTSDFQWMTVITALMTVIPVWLVYRKEVIDSYLSIAIYIILPTFVMPFSGLRQSIAISLGVIAYVFTKKKKLVPFLLTVVFACLFHQSAFLLFVMYPLYRVKITKKWLFAIVPAMITVFIFNKPIFSFLQSLLSDVYNTKAQSTSAYSMLILFVIFCVFAFVIPDDKRVDAETNGLRNFLLFATMIQMFAPLHTLAMRFNYYYIIFLPLLIPRIVRIRRVRYNQIAILAKYIMIIFFISYFWYNVAGKNSLSIFPYQFFWE